MQRTSIIHVFAVTEVAKQYINRSFDKDLKPTIDKYRKIKFLGQINAQFGQKKLYFSMKQQWSTNIQRTDAQKSQVNSTLHTKRSGS